MRGTRCPSPSRMDPAQRHSLPFLRPKFGRRPLCRRAPSAARPAPLIIVGIVRGCKFKSFSANAVRLARDSLAQRPSSVVADRAGPGAQIPERGALIVVHPPHVDHSRRTAAARGATALAGIVGRAFRRQSLRRSQHVTVWNTRRSRQGYGGNHRFEVGSSSDASIRRKRSRADAFRSTFIRSSVPCQAASKKPPISAAAFSS